MCIRKVSDESNPPLNTVKLMVFKVLRLHENTELLPSGDYYDRYTGNNDPIEGIKLVLVGIPVINQLVWVDLSNKD